MKFRFIVLSVLILTVQLIFIFDKLYFHSWSELVEESVVPAANFETINLLTYGNVKRTVVVEKVELLQYDIMRPLSEETNKIECLFLKNAKPPYHLCAHEGADDWLSGQLRQYFVWEPAIQDLIRIFLEDNPDATFVDLGCNIGAHSLFAASVNKHVHVVAVEPFPKNVIRVHKSAHLNNVQSQIKVVMAAVSNKRGPVRFQEKVGSIAENSIVRKGRYLEKGFIVNAILWDDLTPLVKRKKAFIKIDIEGSECHGVVNANKFFSQIDVPYILMEIQHTKQQGQCCFEAMLKFLEERQYKAFNFPFSYSKIDNPLNYSDWINWNYHDVVFKKFYA